jgi:hypothetical protein
MTIKLFAAHLSTEHSPSFPSEQEIFSQLCAVQFLAVFLQGSAESSASLQLVQHT